LLLVGSRVIEKQFHLDYSTAE